MDRRFSESTRGRLVTLLRRSGRTVEELVRELGLTHNGVRAHLATLKRDGIVGQRGSGRRVSGGGKPAYVYGLTPEAEDLFPKAYEPVLLLLLDVLSEQLDPGKSEELLRAAERHLATGTTASSVGLPERLHAAANALNELGGLAELEELDGRPV